MRKADTGDTDLRHNKLENVLRKGSNLCGQDITWHIPVSMTAWQNYSKI